MTTVDERLCNTPMHIPSPLHSLLSTVKGIKAVDTLSEVLEGLKTYIFQHKLFDSGNPSFIKCNDDLSKVLGVQSFTLGQIKRILLRKLLAENRSNYSDILAIVKEDASGKRKGAPPDITADDEVKKLCMAKDKKSEDLFFDDQFSDELDDCYSSDDAEKTLTDDTEKSHTPTVSSGILAINEMYDIEYEVENSSDSNASFTDSESELEDIVSFALLADLAASDSDEAFWADKSSDEDDISDVEIPSSDRWVCKTCNSQNKPPMRYCIKCFRERTGWVADQEKNEMRKSRKKPKNKKKNGALVGAGSSKQQKVSSEKKQDDEFSDLCLLCCAKPKKSVIVHGKSGHSISCYKCARRLLSSTKRCPICQRQIDRVIHLDS